jgi:hypothetical protein
MSALFWLWLVSLSVVLGLFVRGFVRAKITPVSYEWGWSPFSFVSESLFPKGRALLREGQVQFNLFLHRLFHLFFHQMKRFHDRVFGKTAAHTDAGAPSFFLKTIAEHKETVSGENKEERKEGLS